MKTSGNAELLRTRAGNQAGLSDKVVNSEVAGNRLNFESKT